MIDRPFAQPNRKKTRQRQQAQQKHIPPQRVGVNKIQPRIQHGAGSQTARRSRRNRRQAGVEKRDNQTAHD